MASSNRSKTEDITAEALLRALADLDPVPGKGDSLSCEGANGVLRLSAASGPWRGQVEIKTSAWLPQLVTISRKGLQSFLQRVEGPLKITSDGLAVSMSAGRKRVKLSRMPFVSIQVPVPEKWFSVGASLSSLQLLSKFAVGDEILPELLLIRISNGKGFATNRVSAVRVSTGLKVEAIPATVVKHLAENFRFGIAGDSFLFSAEAESGFARFSYQMPEVGGLALDRVLGMLDQATEWPKKISCNREEFLEGLEMLSKAEAEVSTFSLQKQSKNEVVLKSGNEKMEFEYELGAVVKAECNELMLLHPVLSFVKMQEGHTVHVRWQGESAYAVQVDNGDAVLLTPRRA